MANEEKINMVAYIFNHLCEAIKESYKHDKKNMPYVRLLFELFHQSRVIDNLKADNATQDLEESYGNIMSAAILGHMNIIKKMEVVKIEAGLRIRSGKTAYLDDFLVISKMDNP